MTVPAEPRRRGAPSPGALWAGAATSALGALGVVGGVLAVVGHPVRGTVDWLVPLAGLRIDTDPLGGAFMALTGLVAVAVGVYAIGYARHERWARFPLAMLPLFTFALLAVPASGSITAFLFAWELMALTSLALVLTEHHRDEVRSAGVYYAVLTQLGFVAILGGLAWLSSAAGTGDLVALRGIGHALSPGTKNGVFLLTLAGFGSKAGLLPLHAWLPRAHPEAPSPVSALMSAAMVNLGIYGIVLVDFQVLGPGPRWWGVALMLVGAASAVFGVLQASVASDLKRLLAYSTTENMGLIALSLGASMLLSVSGLGSVAAIAATAALIHLAAHAAFKALGFFAAGSVLAGTGLRDLDLLGGLSRRMPFTTAMFGIAALGAAGLPFGAGFVGEWLLLQSLIHAPQGDNTLLSLTMPLAVGAPALTTGLGILAMVKAFGIGFLARPRSEGAANASEASPTMRAGMSIAGRGMRGGRHRSGRALGNIERILASLPSVAEATAPEIGMSLRLPGVAGSVSPAILAAALAGAVALTLLLARWGRRFRPAPAVRPLWAGGGPALTARMQYTATSYAEPLQRVFDDILRPDTDVAVTHVAESRYLIEKVTFRTAPVDAVEQRLYLPVAVASGRRPAGCGACTTGAFTCTSCSGPSGSSSQSWWADDRRLCLPRRRAGRAPALGAPLVVGAMRQIRARLEGRRGSGVAQPWRDLRKLFRKQQVTPEGTTVIFRAAPYVLVGTTLVIAAIVPALGLTSPLASGGDFIAVVGLLFLGTVALALAALDTGTAFGGMGSSRQMTVVALVEPTLLLVLFTLSLRVHSTNLGDIVGGPLATPDRRSPRPRARVRVARHRHHRGVGRLPVDNPATHLELTMIHEAMTLEYAGPRLALVEWASAMRLGVLLTLLANLFFPWGVAPAEPTLAQVAIALGRRDLQGRLPGDRREHRGDLPGQAPPVPRPGAPRGLLRARRPRRHRELVPPGGRCLMGEVR